MLLLGNILLMITIGPDVQHTQMSVFPPTSVELGQFMLSENLSPQLSFWTSRGFR